MAATLADELLSERLANSSFRSDKEDALVKASRLLADCNHPIPDIVADALARVRQSEPIEDETSASEADRVTGGIKAGAKGAFSRLMRSVRPAAFT